MNTAFIRTILICLIATGGSIRAQAQEKQDSPPSGAKESTTNLGDFSVSLAVRDIAASKAFYEKLGFVPTGGDTAEHWVIMQNGSATIGLFQGMFEGNILTFNPSDVRSIQRSLKEKEIPILTEADEATAGPAHVVVKDPDGNIILLDQF